MIKAEWTNKDSLNLQSTCNQFETDTISRQAAIDELETVGYDFSDSGLSEPEMEEVCEAVGDVRQDMINRIKRMPSAQPRKGKWVRGDQEKMIGAQRCSVCNQQTYKGSTTFNYCPNCGAKMEERE